MDLFQLMADKSDLKGKALDRLEGIVAQFTAPSDATQDEALERAQRFCEREWGSYPAGLDALAARHQGRPGGQAFAETLRREAAEPGRMVGEARAARGAMVAFEQPFIDACAALGATRDPWGPLAGWAAGDDGAIPDSLRDALGRACPWPTTIADARAESLVWAQRQQERADPADGSTPQSLPTACAARHQLAVAAWSTDLPAATLADLRLRLDFWESQGDVRGFAVLRHDIERIEAAGGWERGGETTKQRCRRLKQDNPTWSLARIGRELGISRQAVHKHLKMKETGRGV